MLSKKGRRGSCGIQIFLNRKKLSFFRYPLICRWSLSTYWGGEIIMTILFNLMTIIVIIVINIIINISCFDFSQYVGGLGEEIVMEPFFRLH